jgi:hypothetical protein
MPRWFSRLTLFANTVWMVVAITGAANARDDLSTTLTFEACGGPEGLARWNGRPSGPVSTLHLDSTVVHGGRYAVRIERDAASDGNFSSVALRVPVDFAAHTVELRGWLKLDGVTSLAALWQRQDGDRRMLQFDEMQNARLTGTRDWQEFSSTLTLSPRARSITFGALMSGQGRLWVDDLRILVDGRPLAEAPVQLPAPLAVDHAFDHGSGIHARPLSAVQVENLALLAKTWGFLKYHHPAVIHGAVRWDEELFRELPALLAAPDRASARAELSGWITRLGPVPAGAEPVASPQGRPVEPPLAWLSDRSVLGDTLSAQLLEIYARRGAVSDQAYVSVVPGVGNPDFSSEAAYADADVPDAGYRLLALFRFWNIVQYWSPYREVAGEDWDQVLREYIPRLFAAASRDDYERVMGRLIATLNDSHAMLANAMAARPPFGGRRVPVRLRFLGDTLVVDGWLHPALGPASGLRIGDVIRSIDGAPVDSLVAAWQPYYPASNEAARRRDIAAAITRGGGETVTLGILRGGRSQSLVVSRAPGGSLSPGLTHDRDGETFQRLSDDVAYLKLSSVKAADCGDYLRRAAGARCLIIDIRNYPSEFVALTLGQHLVAWPTPFARFIHGDLSNPGSFAWTDSESLTPVAPRFAGRVAMLVDETTQSQAEFTAMAFRAAPGALVVGSTTAGADGNVSTIPLPGGLVGKITGTGVFHPDRSPTQRIGIVPDLVVRPTVAGLGAGRDEVMEAAVQRVLGRAMTEAERGSSNTAALRR